MRAVEPGERLRCLLAGNGGSISVERFMHEALYEAGQGYYARRVRTVGRGGDFSTSATLHPALGRSVAAWAASHHQSVRHRGRWHLIELGGGSGELAAEILRSLPWMARMGLRYHLVELSPRLKAEQQRRLAGRRHVRWHGKIGPALEAANGRALIFSNEFVDAFPCVQLARENAGDPWREVCVAWPDGTGHPIEEFRPWHDPAPGSALDESWTVAAGQRVEIHFSYQRWLAEWLPRWHAGRLLTIDYGDRLPGLYHRRAQGTLRAYCRHVCFTGHEVFARFGQQDITADVNFTDLQNWGEAAGLLTAGFSSQADFLRRWLPPKQLLESAAEPALAFLLDPAGAGGAFKVLEQVRPRPQYAA